MTTNWPTAAIVLLTALELSLTACASAQDAYRSQADAARLAYSQGQYRTAAEHWRAAAGLASEQRDQDEAVYRRSTSLRRAGDRQAAAQVLERLVGSPGVRQASAAFDRAYLLIELGQEQAGYSDLWQALQTHPSSGAADLGLLRLVQHLEAEHGPDAALRRLSLLENPTRGTDLEETLLYRRAQLLESAGKQTAALRAYAILAKRFTYPSGVYWDEAMLRQAELLLELGQPSVAAEKLRAMLRQREHADLVGSYERRYSAAHFRLAELYRDELDDWQRARAAFRAVASRYKTSRLRDDARWQAAVISQRHDDRRGACEDAEALLSESPASRFVQCTTLVCAEISEPRQHSGMRRECPEYVLEQWSEPTQKRSGPDGH